jgi:ABC-type multidrug transport system fused ATPase/permease subunit
MSAERIDKNASQRPQGPRRGGGPMGGFGMPVQKAKNFKGTLKRLIRYLKPHRINLIIVLIFAIASTIFTIVAPKVTSKAMNKLQDGYMARTMLSKMTEAQNKASTEMNNKMGDAQKKAVDQIVSKMAEGQNKAIDQITTSMDDAQVKAVDAIYDGMASSLYSGMAKGQKTAVDQICKQMAAAQKGIVTQVNMMMQQAQQNPQAAAGMDPSTLAALQQLMKLPAIDSISNMDQKVKTTIDFVNLLQKMPPMPGSQSGAGKMDPKALTKVKSMLALPMLESIKDPQQKVDTMKKFIQLSNTKLPFDSETMEKIYARIPKIDTTAKSSSSSTSTSNIDKDATAAVQDLLKLPMLNTISDPAQKNDTLVRLIDIFKRLPSMSENQNASSSTTKMDPASLDSIKKLLALPKIDTITDAAQKNKAVLELVDIFKTMPDMSTGSDSAKSDQTFDKGSLDSISELLKLPALDTIKDAKQKTEVTTRMLDIFGKMPKMDTNTDTKDNKSENEFDPESMKAVKEFLQLPKLDTLTDPAQKADVCRKIMDLGKKMQNSVSGISTGTDTKVSLTDDQIEGVFRAIKETNGEYDFHYIGIIALILIGMYIISACFSLIMGLVMSGVAQKTVSDLRREVDVKLSRLPLKYFDMHPHGDILSRVTNDVDTISTTLQQSLTQVITSIITIIGYIIMMLTISPILTLIVIVTLPLYIIATATIAKKSQKYFGAQQKELGELSGHVEEMYTGHKIVKAFGHEKDSIEKFEETNKKLNTAGAKAQFVSGIMFPLMNFISNLGYVAISIVGGIYITKNILGLGDILAFIQYSRSFTMPIVQTANIANIIQSTVACAERVFEVIDEEEEIPDSRDAVALEFPRGDVKFENVDFRYKEDVPLIENMNLDVRKGHTVAIVGPTGAGKTTLVNLLMRFYEINAGKISVDGIDIKDIKRSELRKMFGMVLQDTWLFNGTIRDNIAYGKKDVTLDEIKRAAKAAHADHFIRTLPEGYDTVLNEEATNISQGQKQLLTISRAILADPTILILDEATSSVDTRTEVLIQKAMANLMRNRTSFVIAHRLSTIRDAELILVMNKGSIIEMGNHKELLAKGGFYADLYNSQFTGANLEAEAVS